MAGEPARKDFQRKREGGEMTQPELFQPIKPKRKKPVSLTIRSRKYLEQHGYITSLVERSVDVPKFPGSTERFRNKFDCFGFADLVAVHPEKPGTLYIQVTDHSHAAEHRKKMLLESKVPIILQASNRIQLHLWKSSKRKGIKRWCLKSQTAILNQWEGTTAIANRMRTVELTEPSEHWFRDNMQEVEPTF
jgi:hypothetical protein